MKTVIINQARMSSTRLPGKVLKTVLGRPLLDFQLERLRRVRHADKIVVATTTGQADAPLAEYCRKHDVACYRGQEEDVLSRYYGAAIEHGADIIVRVTSDCPLIDPAVVDKIIATYRANSSECAYASNTLDRTYPRGLDCEVFSFHALESAHSGASSAPEREHVTPYIYHNPDRFPLVSVVLEEDLSEHRWTVDTPEDFELIRLMLEALYPQKANFTLDDCLDVLKANPAWSDINRAIEQKAYGQ